ncbi:hypothetical protein CCZ01_00795 [Helicobacter monodelphidis]|uniref:DUF5408 family protein n=1 Tax=Helicobacter sp. 15-1451 TaxID=2004995 RepID=UPI000DCB6A9D|nr:DUF5408 family protein [Helicobacter sp. 15-1451]RAX59306.1 hypothetical protein CCZ01_00795 [Helicobacter sp. 15-1451]
MKEALNQSKRAIQISLISILVLLILGSVGLWIMVNQVVATAQMSQQIKLIEYRLQQLESNSTKVEG